MKRALNSKHKMRFITSQMKKPVETSSNFEWDSCNNMVMSWLTNSMTDELAGSVLYYSTVDQLWANIKQRFDQSNGPLIH